MPKIDGRYKVEIWVDKNGVVEKTATAYPTLSRVKDGALPSQTQVIQVNFDPSASLKALLKTEIDAVVESKGTRS